MRFDNRFTDTDIGRSLISTQPIEEFCEIKTDKTMLTVTTTVGCIPDPTYLILDATDISKKSLFQVVFQRYIYVLTTDQLLIISLYSYVIALSYIYFRGKHVLIR